MFRRMLREFFSLTRRERRGQQVLAGLIVLLILARVFIPRFVHPPVPDFSQEGSDFMAFYDSLTGLRMGSGIAADIEKISGNTGNSSKVERFPFDPNTAEFEDLTRLGMSPRTAHTLIKYRQAGGYFSRDSDLLKIYGLSHPVFEQLQSSIRISPKEDDFLKDSLHRSPLFELNRADSQQLVSVYGIGPAFARRILGYRELLGGFYRKEQLMEVYGFSQEQTTELFKRSYIDTSELKMLMLNSMDADSLSRHPYLDPYQANALISFRLAMGSYNSTLQVFENKLLPDSVFTKIHPYLDASR